MKQFFMKYSLTAVSIGCICFGFTDMDDQKEMPNQEKKVITPDAFPVVHSGYDVFVTSDFIYWTARGIGPQDFFSSSHSIGHGKHVSQESSNDREVISVKNKVSPGFKAGIGLDVKHDGWDTYFEYTYLHTSESGTSATIDNGGTNDPNPLLDSTHSYKSTVKQSSRLHFNTIDWELGRNFFISPKLLLRPVMGLKGTWQKLSWHRVTTNINNDSSGPRNSQIFSRLNTEHENERGQRYVWAFGPRIGVDTSWQFDRNWSLFSDVFIDTLWGRMKTSSNNTLSRIGIDRFKSDELIETTVSAGGDDFHFHDIFPVIELVLGARWDYWFSDDAYRIRIQAGWEYQQWFNLQELQGLTLDFRFDF